MQSIAMTRTLIRCIPSGVRHERCGRDDGNRGTNIDVTSANRSAQSAQMSPRRRKRPSPGVNRSLFQSVEMFPGKDFAPARVNSTGCVESRSCRSVRVTPPIERHCLGRFPGKAVPVERDGVNKPNARAISIHAARWRWC